MSHFTCAVFTNARSGRALRAEIGQIMEPFGPHGSGKWEWYEADSRFASVLRLKDGGSAPAAVLADVDFSFDLGAVVTPDGEGLDGAGAPLAWEQGGCAELVSSQDPSLYVSILNCRI